MKLRWKILIGIGIFLILMTASLMVTMHLQPQSELEAYKKELRAKGEKLELREVLRLPIAMESNSVDAFTNAFAHLAPDFKIPYSMQMVASGKAMVGWSQPDVRGWDFTNSWQELGANFETNRAGIALLRSVLDRPCLNFNLDYKMGLGLPITHLIMLKKSAQALETATILDLHNNDIDAATTNILIFLAIIHNNSSEGLLISHMVRMTLVAIAVPMTWELLQSTNTSEVQLAALQQSWSQLNILSDAEKSVATERAWLATEIEKIRNVPETLSSLSSGMAASSPSGGSDWAEILADSTEGPRLAMGEVMWRYSWSYSQECQMMQIDQIILEAVRKMQTNQSQYLKKDYDAAASRLSSSGFTNIGSGIFHALKIPDFSDDFSGPGLDTCLRKALRVETARRVVVTAIALKRFQLKKGRYPETLDELTPQFLPAAPIDPYVGKPLKYRVNTDGTFLLYSAGEDGIDEGGDTTDSARGDFSRSWDSRNAHDWVWPQPATPAQIEYFYEHPSK